MTLLSGLSPYAGLLSPDEQSDVRQNLMMNFGLGLLANSGPSQVPQTFGQIAGKAGMSAADQNNQFSQSLVQNRLLKQKIDDEQKQKDTLAMLIGKPGQQVPMGPPSPNGGMGTVTEPGTGFLGGKMTPDQLFAGLAGLGGDYTKIGVTGLTNTLQANQGRGEYIVPVQTAQGVFGFDTRRGRYVDPVTGNTLTKPLVGSASDPALQGRIAREKEFGQTQGNVEAVSTVKKPAQAKETIALLDEAEKLVDSSTGSYVGTGVDAAARMFGKSTEGANAAARLKVLQAAMMTNMPRMEGPQSDRDVELYKQAAGDIGDPTMPNERKKAALQTIRTINEKYASRGQDNPAPPASPKVRRYNPQTGKIED